MQYLCWKTLLYTLLPELNIVLPFEIRIFGFAKCYSNIFDAEPRMQAQFHMSQHASFSNMDSKFRQFSQSFQYFDAANGGIALITYPVFESRVFIEN